MNIGIYPDAAIRIQTTPGAHILRVAECAKRLADLTGIMVEWDFNGVPCRMMPGGSPQFVLDVYNRDNRNRINSTKPQPDSIVESRTP